MSQILIALIGKVNAGKSALCSSLLGEHWRTRASPVPGYTKEIGYYALSPHIAIADTPGLGDVSEQVAAKALAVLSEAHVVLHVINAAEGVTAEVARTHEVLRERGIPTLVVANRIDLVAGADRPDVAAQFRAALGVDEVIATSPKTAHGVADLAARLHALFAERGDELLFIRWFRERGPALDARLRAEADEVVLWAAGRAVGIGVLPMVSFPAHMANEIYMVKRIGEIYGLELSEALIKGFLTALGATVVGLGLSSFIPGFGGALAAAVTYAAGRTAIVWCADGGEISQARLKEIYESEKRAYGSRA